MVRGFRDYTRVIGRAETVGLTVDMVPRPMAGTGKVILVDTFQDTLLKWTGGTRITTKAFHGGACLQLTDEETQRWFAMVPRRRIGFEFMWQIDDFLDLEALYASLLWYDGVYLHDSRIRYFQLTKKWYYYDQTGWWKEIPGSEQPRQYEDYVWHNLKQEVHFDVQEYTYLRVNRDHWSLTGLKFEKSASTVEQHARARISVVPLAGKSVVGYIDCVILTEED